MCRKNRFPELQGYMRVSYSGDYTFEDNCPEELKEKIRKEWPEYKKEVLEKRAKGIEDSTDWF